MHLAAPGRILKIWKYAIEQGANVVLMRHAPKAGSNESGLSEEGRRLAIRYGNILRLDPIDGGLLVCTTKDRTMYTLKYMFPFSDESAYLRPRYLEVNKVSPFVQDQVNCLHKEIGRFRGYYLNHTYYFLEKLGGRFDEENIHTVVAQRMVKGIKQLFEFASSSIVIYCGHSPSIEVGCERLLGLTLSELGGFLNPLDSIHLRVKENKVEWIARVNPIVGYVDLESETYF